MKFRESEKVRYKAIKSMFLSKQAQTDGTYNGIVRSFCINDINCSENLFSGIRSKALNYFSRRDIPWHDGLKGRTEPSNHLCCSQSCCVNFLYPFVDDAKLLKNVFLKYYPDIEQVLPIEPDTQEQDRSSPFLVFEWIGTRDYLNETIRKPGERTRGANYTSADFAFRYQSTTKDESGESIIHLVLGEWKYTEEYGNSDKGTNKTRLGNYQASFIKDEKWGGVFPQKFKYLYRALFYEPFYQLMRLQLLAQEMQQNNELGADVVSVLHVSPKANKEFRDKVTSPDLLADQNIPIKKPLDIWRQIIPEDKFKSIGVEEIRDEIVTKAGDRAWKEYLALRYGWK